MAIAEAPTERTSEIGFLRGETSPLMATRTLRFQNPEILYYRAEHTTVDDRNPASPYIHIEVLYYQNSFTFGMMRPM